MGRYPEEFVKLPKTAISFRLLSAPKFTSRTNGTDEKKIVFEEADGLTSLSPATPVSMNFWGFKPSVFPLVQHQFESYAIANINSPKAEFYIPTVMSNLIQTDTGHCKVFRSQSAWFGVTYPDDKPVVQAALKELHDGGAYPEKLW